jgi:hypothetical protein
VNPAANEEEEQANEDSEGVEEQDNGSEEGDEESVEEEEEDGVESVDSRPEDDDGEMAIDVPPVAMHNGSSYTRTPLTQDSNANGLLFYSASGSRFRV